MDVGENALSLGNVEMRMNNMSHMGNMSKCRMTENPFKDAPTVKEYVLDKYDMGFILWIKELMGKKEFDLWGETPVCLPSYKESLDIKLMQMFTLFQQRKIIETTRDVTKISLEATRDVTKASLEATVDMTKASLGVFGKMCSVLRRR